MIPSNTWHIINTRHDPHSLGQHNSVFTISNGYLGLKGNVCEDRHGYCPVTLINGVYDELDMFSLIRASNEERRYLDPRFFGTAGRSPAVANLPNPLMVRMFVGDEEVSLERGEVVGFHQALLMSRGAYIYEFTYRDRRGRTTWIKMSRFASLAHPHRAFMRYTVKANDHDAPIRILTGIDAAVYSNTTRERQFDVITGEADATGRCTLHVRTPARGHDAYVGVVNSLGRPSRLIDVRGVVEYNAVYTSYEFAPEPNEAVTIDRCIALTCSEDERFGVAADPDAELTAAARQGFRDAAAENEMQWKRLWERADVKIDGDERAQRYLRFCLFHLLAAAPRHTDKLSVPVKLLTGEYYQGNTFYDTDTYIVPFYTFAFPEWSRAHLNWRWIGLEPARKIARDFGYDGAKFAWQAGPYGEECLGRWWRFVHTNVHIDADVAYALMQYYRATGDEAFLAEKGIDILVETARFYAARVVYDADRDAYDMRDVAGPDEGHCESTNNFHTNYLAIRNLRWAARMLERLRSAAPAAHAAAVERLCLRPDEPSRWLHVADRLTLLFDPVTKLYEQCEGFYRLKPAPPDLLANRRAWFETVFPYQAMNQPDVVMAMCLFRDDFEPDVRRANWDFYKDKSLNFSSMSFAINSIMAADAGEIDRAYSEFLITAGQDLDEELTGREDTYAGLHGTAAGGAWMAAVFGFGGVRLSEEGLWIDPRLPPAWRLLRFKLMLRGHVLDVAIDPYEVVVAVEGDGLIDMPVTVAGRSVTLEGGQTYRIAYVSMRAAPGT